MNAVGCNQVTPAIDLTTCSEGDVITPEQAYADILNTAVMGLTTRVKTVTRKS